MYFKGLIEHYGTLPKYFVDDIIQFSNQFKFNHGRRNIIGAHNLLMAGSAMSVELVTNVNFLLSYISSQHFDILKHKVVYEKTLVKPGARMDSYDFPTNRYVNRIGESIFAPIQGSAIIRSKEFPNGSGEMTVGNIYRVNTRCVAEFETTDDFVVAVYTYGDFDMYKYLMPHDFNGPFPRRVDENLNWQAGTMVAEEEPERNAY